MIKHLEYHQIDKAKWDDCIRKSVNSLVYGYSWYLDIVCEHWEALVEDDYKSVFPLTAGKKYGMEYLYQPSFAQQLGLFSKDVCNREKIESFLYHIPEQYKFAEINLNFKNKFILNSDFGKGKIEDEIVKGIKIVEKTNLELKLIENYDTIYKNYSVNHKRNLKKALQSGFKLLDNADIDDVITLFKNNKGKEITSLKDKQYEILKRLVRCENFIFKIPGVQTKDGNLCAGIVIVESGKRRILLFSGNTAVARQHGAMQFIIDNYIKDNSGKELILDFEGSNDKNLARFYKGFGARENNYYFLRKNDLPLHVRATLNFTKWIKKQLQW